MLKCYKSLTWNEVIINKEFPFKAQYCIYTISVCGSAWAVMHVSTVWVFVQCPFKCNCLCHFSQHQFNSFILVVFHRRLYLRLYFHWPLIRQSGGDWWADAWREVYSVVMYAVRVWHSFLPSLPPSSLLLLSCLHLTLPSSTSSFRGEKSLRCGRSMLCKPVTSSPSVSAHQH